MSPIQLYGALLASMVMLVLAGCGGDASPSAESVLAETAGNLGQIRSGDLELSLVVSPRRGDPFGFELRGPFSLRRAGPLPVLDVEYTQIANGSRGTVRLVSTGRKAYAVIGRRVRVLDRAQRDELRRAAGVLEAGGGLDQLPIDEWIVEPELSAGGSETERVQGTLDVVAVVNGLLELARGFGQDLPAIEGESADRLRRATRSSTFDLHAGEDDRMLRRLELSADFGLEVPPDLRGALGRLVGARVAFTLGVGRPNRAVRVAAPAP